MSPMGEQPGEGREVIVIEMDAETYRVREVRGCPGIYTVLCGTVYVGGFRSAGASEAALREEAELVIEEARAAVGL